jgi:hypothetical protein
MRIFLITIDLPKLRANLSREDGRDLAESEVLSWLSDAGFTRVESGWTVREPDLGQLDPSEVIAAEVIEESGS